LAAVRHLGFWKFNFLMAWTVKRRILHNRAKFREDLSIPCFDIAICVVFEDDDRRHLVFLIRNYNGLSPVGGPICVNLPNFIKIGQTVAEIYGDLTVFKLAAVRHLGFWKFNFLMAWTVKRRILHNHAKFHEDRSIRCCDIAIFVVFEMAAAAIVVFEKFEEILTVCPL